MLTDEPFLGIEARDWPGRSAVTGVHPEDMAAFTDDVRRIHALGTLEKLKMSRKERRADQAGDSAGEYRDYLVQVSVGAINPETGKRRFVVWLLDNENARLASVTDILMREMTSWRELPRARVSNNQVIALNECRVIHKCCARSKFQISDFSFTEITVQ